MRVLSHDLRAEEIPARDVAVGDLVGGSLVRRTHTVVVGTRLLTMLHLDDASLRLPAEAPITVRAAICEDCGHCPTDCECQE